MTPDAQNEPAEYPYRWAWRKRLGQYYGKPCRVLARLAMNSCIVEFEDGVWHCTSRNGLRKRHEA